jgi:transcriptional regulator with XRE-family HTH domain
MNSMQLVGLNTKWYRYQKNWTQEDFAERTNFKMAYISTIETGNANLTCKNIDALAKTFNIKPDLLFESNTAIKAKELPQRVDMYIRNKKSS